MGLLLILKVRFPSLLVVQRHQLEPNSACHHSRSSPCHLLQLRLHYLYVQPVHFTQINCSIRGFGCFSPLAAKALEDFVAISLFASSIRNGLHKNRRELGQAFQMNHNLIVYVSLVKIHRTSVYIVIRCNEPAYTSSSCPSTVSPSFSSGRQDWLAIALQYS
jgi:hypothetical protein